VACTPVGDDDDAADSGSGDTAAEVLPEPTMKAENILTNEDYFATADGAARVDSLFVFSYEAGVPVYAWFGYALDSDGVSPMNCAVGYEATVKDTDIEWCDMYCDAGGTFVTGSEAETYGSCGNVDLAKSAEEDFEQVRIEAGYQAVQKRGPSAEYHDVIMVGGSSVTTFATSEGEGFNDGTSWAAQDGDTLWIYGRAYSGDVI
jgi:hypothetical protein